MCLNATFKTYLADITRRRDAQEESFYPALGALLGEATQPTVLRFVLRLLLLIGTVPLLVACAALLSPSRFPPLPRRRLRRARSC